MMRLLSQYSLFFCLVFICLHADAQEETATAPTLSELLIPTFVVPNEAGMVLLPSLPSQVRLMQTPLQVRYTMMGTIPAYEITAACNPVALSFFGTKDPTSPELCTRDNVAIIISYMTLRLFESQFPLDAARYAAFLTKVGLKPFNRSTDMSTPIGWANVMAQRLVSYFENDGWNSMGQVTKRHFRQPYEDTTQYRPENPAHLLPGELRRPLRWQPLRMQVDQRGWYADQRHITPHIGLKVKPLVMSKRELMQRQVESPYETPNKWRRIGKADKKKMLRLINKLFAMSARLTKKQAAMSAFWDNKFSNIAFFNAFYQKTFKIDPFNGRRINLGESLALHDATILAWKEKRRHDLVRPPTLIRRLLKGQIVQAYKSFKEGIGPVKASEWEPVIAIQPHSEFPSASALLCKMTLEHLQLAVEDVVPLNGSTLPPYTVTIGPGLRPVVPNNPIPENVTLTFSSLNEAARLCGKSRLWAGVHFAPSVKAGFELGTGLGEMVFQHAKDLWEGRVPKNCARCIKR